MQDFLD